VTLVNYVTRYLSQEIVTRLPIYSMQIYPIFAIAMLTTIEQIFPLFQRDLVEKSTPEVDQVQFVTLVNYVTRYLSQEIVTRLPIYSMQIYPNIAIAILTTIEQIFSLFQRCLIKQSTPEVDQL